MSINKRKLHSSAFKAKVALEANKGNRTIAQLCSEYGVVSSCLTNWKKQLLDGAQGLFENPKAAKKSQDSDMAELVQVIGHLTIENAYLKKKCGN